MTEYRIEFTSNRGEVTVRPWVKCDEAMAKRAFIEAAGNMRWFGWTNITIRKREESVLWSLDMPEFALQKPQDKPLPAGI